MPDWISHLLAGLILAKILKVKKKSLILLGTLLPDLIFQSYHLNLFIRLPENTEWFIMLFHLPFALIIMSVVIPFFFKYSYWKSFMFLSVGWISHIILDMINLDTLSHCLLFLPFSWKCISLGKYIIPDFFFFIIILLNLYLLLIIYDYVKHKRIIW